MPAPPRITPSSLADYLEAMSRAVFSSGISWQVIDAKWDGIRKAFDGFDPEAIAGYTPDDIDRLMADPHVVRNRKKIEATVANAGTLIVMDREFGGFNNHLTSFADNEALVLDLHAHFKFLGEPVAHFFLYAIGFNIPAQDEWAHKHFASMHHHE